MKQLLLALAVSCLSLDALAGGRRQAERAWNVEIELVRYELGSWYWLADDLSLARSLWQEGQLEQSQAVLVSLDAALARDRARIAENIGEKPLVGFERALESFHQEQLTATTPGREPTLGGLGLRVRARADEDEDEDEDRREREREPRREIERQRDSAPDPTEREPLPRPTER